MKHKCAAYIYVKPEEGSEPVSVSAELQFMLDWFPDAAKYPNQGIVVFAQTHPEAFEPIDASLYVDSETDEETTAIAQLLNLISTHDSPNAVHISIDQVREVYSILNIEEEPEKEPEEEPEPEEPPE